MNSRSNRGSSGFTILEMLIVLVIVGIAAAIGIPLFLRAIYIQELVQSQQILIQQINAGRSGSKRNSQTYWVEWKNSTPGGSIEVVRKYSTGANIVSGVDTVIPTKLGSNVSVVSTGANVSNTLGYDSRVIYTAPYGRLGGLGAGGSNISFTLTHANLPGVSYTINVMGVTGKVVRREKS
jgi:prepilin-type N-terminal cleavage/methylation domain-containing protein